MQGRLDPHILISYEDLRFEKCNLPGGVFGKVPAESEVTRVFPGRFEINGFFLGGQKGARWVRAVPIIVVSRVISLVLAIYRGYTHF